FPALASAHGLEAGRGEVQLRDETVALVVALPESLFLAHDTNHDGALSREEVAVARDTLRHTFLERLALRDGDDHAGEVRFFDVGVPSRRSVHPYVRFTVEIALANRDAVGVAHDFALDAPLWLEAERVTRAPSGRWARVGEHETLHLTRGVSRTLLARVREAAPPLRAPSSLPSLPAASFVWLALAILAFGFVVRRQLVVGALASTLLFACGGDDDGVTDASTEDDAGAETSDAATANDASIAEDAGTHDDAGAPTCDDPGTPTTPVPVARPQDDFNVTPLACTRTATALACELGVGSVYEESVAGGVRTLVANGVPSHDVGDFPNDGNPNAIAAQSYTYEVPVTPSGTGGPAQVFGLLFSGVVLDPGTAEVWNGNDAWRYEALLYGSAPDYFGSDSTFHPDALGLDCNFAHVQPGGAYHYHGVPTGLAPSTPEVRHVGWAADGAPIVIRYGHSDPSDADSEIVELRSSYRLRSGTRPAGSPGGTYDGTFVGDWEYVEGLGDLDACNGRTGVVTVEGATREVYHYVLTHEFPFIPRCTTYAADPSFARGDMGGGMGLPTCMPGQRMCCGDGVCGGPENATNCPADCS
ncbi:MAG: YHYH protein, partial [Myxococcales bacterium]|nr:YHYH protein [Myxococcales bacterium]